MFQMMNHSLFMGIDGGGTGCRALVGTAAGEPLGSGKSGAANIATDPDGACRHIVAAATEALIQADIDPAKIAEVDAFLGLAGANVDAYAKPVQVRLPFRRCIVAHDALISLQGAVGDGDGCIGILGTGSAFLARRGDQVKSIGGWGFFVSDHGSGARLGQSLLTETLLSHDGVQPHSALTRAVLELHDKQPQSIMQFSRTATPGDFGRLAPRVFEYADAGDPVALRIVSSAVADIEGILDVLLDDSDTRLSLCGGLAQCYLPYLNSEIRERIDPPINDAVSGALALARQHFTAPPAGQVKGQQ